MPQNKVSYIITHVTLNTINDGLFVNIWPLPHTYLGVSYAYDTYFDSPSPKSEVTWGQFV